MEKARKLAFEKPLPTYLRCTTYGEQYHENIKLTIDGSTVSTFDDEVYPGGWSDLTTYLAPDFCLGTASRPITFTASNPTATSPCGGQGRWLGILFGTNSVQNRIQYALIEYACTGIAPSGSTGSSDGDRILSIGCTNCASTSLAAASP